MKVLKCRYQQYSAYVCHVLLLGTLCVLVSRVGKLKKPSAQLNWVLLLEQMRSFVGGFSRDQVTEDPVCCELTLCWLAWLQHIPVPQFVPSSIS